MREKIECDEKIKKNMGGAFSSPKTVVLPLQKNPVVSMTEVERLSKSIEQTIAECSADRALLKSKYGVDPASVEIDSCAVTLPFYGNREKTFQLVKNRFERRVKVLELGTKEYPDQDDDNYGCSTVFFFERSTIKIVV